MGVGKNRANVIWVALGGTVMLFGLRRLAIARDRIGVATDIEQPRTQASQARLAGNGRSRHGKLGIGPAGEIVARAAGRRHSPLGNRYGHIAPGARVNVPLRREQLVDGLVCPFQVTLARFLRMKVLPTPFEFVAIAIALDDGLRIEHLPTTPSARTLPELKPIG
jgi:hypothetical protein